METTIIADSIALPEWAERVDYLSSSYKDGHFRFTYQIDGQNLELNLTHSVRSDLDQHAIETIGFNIGLCYLMDLSEIVLTKTIGIYRALSVEALSYWQHLYEELVIEKCYALQISTTHKNVSWDVKSGDPADDALLSIHGPRDAAALCLTGGKESLAILKTLEDKKPLFLFFLDLETNSHRQKVYQAVKDTYPTVRTTSDRKLKLDSLEKQYLGLQSGVDMAHLVFNTMLYADKCEYVLIGNEYSSNYPNEIYEGAVVNHQFVKTIHFAENLNNYIHEHVTKDFTYYSPFFGLYEYKIADLLFKDRKYLDVWTSCNQTTPEVNFCSKCYKCAFTYLLARTKVSSDYLSQIFSNDMLQSVEIYKPIMDFVGVKPLDCVGDKTEVWVALEELLARGESAAVIDYYRDHIRPVIEPGLPGYIERIGSVQSIPVDFPADIKTLFYGALGLK